MNASDFFSRACYLPRMDGGIYKGGPLSGNTKSAKTLSIPKCFPRAEDMKIEVILSTGKVSPGR